MSSRIYQQILSGEITINKDKLKHEINLLNQEEEYHISKLKELFYDVNHITEYDVLTYIFGLKEGKTGLGLKQNQVKDNGATITINYDGTWLLSEEGGSFLESGEVTAFVNKIVAKPAKIRCYYTDERSMEAIEGGKCIYYFGYTKEDRIKLKYNNVIHDMYNKLKVIHDIDTNDMIKYITEYLLSPNLKDDK